MDSKEHASDNLISLSKAWNDLKSSKHLHEVIDLCAISQPEHQSQTIDQRYQQTVYAKA
jgi:hypothetical protein